MPVEQINQTVHVLRYKNGYSWAPRRKRHAPDHAEAISHALKGPREIAHIDGESVEVPFDAHQEKLLFPILMLIRVQNVPVRAKNEIGD
jgi:hypothetical protein